MTSPSPSRSSPPSSSSPPPASRRRVPLAFALGSGLAALGGARGAEILAIDPGYAQEHLIYFLIVVAVGGLGSIKGPFFAALLLGITDTAFKYKLPEFGAFFIYAMTLALLLWRPPRLVRRPSLAARPPAAPRPPSSRCCQA